MVGNKEGVISLADLPQEARMALQASAPKPTPLHPHVRAMCRQVVLEKTLKIEERYMGPRIVKGYVSDSRRKRALDGTSTGAILLHQRYHAS